MSQEYHGQSEISMGEAALWYARADVPVFPVHCPFNYGLCSCGDPNCKDLGKHPATPHGYKDATVTQEQITAWWSSFPFNIGMPTGMASGRVVLDCDPRHGGPTTREELMERLGHPIPDTTEIISGSGGRHVYFACAMPVPTRQNGLGPGIDVSGDNHYILLPPSAHKSGRRYEFDGIGGMLDFLKAAPLPDWLMDRLLTPNSNSNGNKADYEIPDEILEGHRHQYLLSMAGTLRRRGYGLEEILATLSTLNKSRCRPPKTEKEIRKLVEDFCARYPAGESHWQESTQADDGEWPAPANLESGLLPVEVFDEELLPEAFKPLVTDIAYRMQVPMDYAAVAQVVSLAGVVGRRAWIHPKAKDTSWMVVPSVWGGVVAPPGFLKSPVLQVAIRPVKAIQAEFVKDHEEALIRYAIEKEEQELRLATWKELYKAALKSGDALPARPSGAPEEPKLRRLVANDATFEALHQIMSQNPAGIFLIRDELAGWWSSLDKVGSEGARAFALEAWAGDSSFTIDRIARGTVHVPHCCMSMLGGIQPGRLRSYLADAINDGPANDGLIQRFQLLVWPDSPTDWTYVDRPPNADAERRIINVLAQLVKLDPENPLRFHFADDAQQLFKEWLAELEAKLRGGELHPALVSHLSKYRKLMPSLALLFELVDGKSTDGTVSLDHATQAADWCEYMESHARRVYGCIVSPQVRASGELAAKIKSGQVRLTDGIFHIREVYRKGWTGLDTPTAVKAAAEILVEANWLRPAPGESSDPLGRGRPANRYQVNPKALS